MRICTLFICIVFCLTFSAFSQDVKNIQKKNVVVTGFETGNPHTQNEHIKIESVKFNPVVTQNLTYTFQPTNLFTGYDLQSNGTPQQIWQDPGDPNNVYMVFTQSSQISGWSDRNGTFMLSDDMGQNWQNYGSISEARGGFVTISGLNDGRPVAALHTDDGITTTRSQAYVRNTAGTNWSRYDPGSAPTGDPIWPRVLGIGNNNVHLLSSIDGAPDDDFFINSLNISNGTYSGWDQFFGAQAEAYNLAKSSDETVLGLVFMGNMNSIGNLYYTESLDNGLTWSDVLLLYTFGQAGDSLGAFRGVDIIFLNSVPYIVFEVVKQDTTAVTYFPFVPSKIMLWSPALNNGIAKVIADENNIPFIQPFNTREVMGPLGRPSIGKSADDQALFITINASTEDYMVIGQDTITYFAGYFMYSPDQGQTFSLPERFTPSSPLRDWKYISLNPVNYVDPLNRVHVMMAAQADTIPGSNIYAYIPYPTIVSAELVFVSTEVQLSGTASAIIVTLPNGGENWAVGTDKSIHWMSSNVSSVKLEYTTDQGSNWITIASSVPNTGSYLWTVPNTPSDYCRVKISNPSNLIINDISNSDFSITEKSVALTTPNGGEIWHAGSIQEVIWTSSNVIDIKLELSINNGVTWTDVVSSAPSTGIYNWVIPNIQSLQCRIRISDVLQAFVLDISDDVFAIQPTSSAGDWLPDIPTEFVLYQNFPNPFNPVTTIYYGIPEGSYVRLNVFNLLGEKIAELVNEYKEPGNYKINFNFEKLNSGLYLYKIEAVPAGKNRGNFIQTKKMIFMK